MGETNTQIHRRSGSLQSALCICGLHIHGFNQPWTWNLPMRRADCTTVWGLKQRNVIVIQFWKLKFKMKVSAGGFLLRAERKKEPHASPLVSGGLLVILGNFWLVDLCLHLYFFLFLFLINERFYFLFFLIF